MTGGPDDAAREGRTQDAEGDGDGPATPDGSGERRTFADVITDALTDRHRITVVSTDDGRMRITRPTHDGPKDAA